MSILDQIAGKIIKEQELVIGPLAWSEAHKVVGVTVLDESEGKVSLPDANPQTAIDQLVARYEKIFGPASREVCKEAVSSLLADLSPAEMPLSLA